MTFLPLAIATMRGEAVCVAGVDVDSGEWVRPVARKYRCLFSEQTEEKDALLLDSVTALGEACA